MTRKEIDKFFEELFPPKETVRQKMIRQLKDPYHNPFNGEMASEQFDLAMQVRSGVYESGNHETDYYLEQYYGSDYEDDYEDLLHDDLI